MRGNLGVAKHSIRHLYGAHPAYCRINGGWTPGIDRVDPGLSTYLNQISGDNAPAFLGPRRH